MCGVLSDENPVVSFSFVFPETEECPCFCLYTYLGIMEHPLWFPSDCRLGCVIYLWLRVILLDFVIEFVCTVEKGYTVVLHACQLVLQPIFVEATVPLVVILLQIRMCRPPCLVVLPKLCYFLFHFILGLVL